MPNQSIKVIRRTKRTTQRNAVDVYALTDIQVLNVAEMLCLLEEILKARSIGRSVGEQAAIDAFREQAVRIKAGQ